MELLLALQNSALAQALRGADVFYPFLSALHIIAFGVLLGAIGTLDLRLLGAFQRAPLATFAAPLSRMAALGLATALVTGFLLFSVRPTLYVQNTAFVAKVALAALGILNALILHNTPHWKLAIAGGTIARRIKFMAAFSLLLWTSAIIAGRWIAFVA